jgi:S1-C subfamily serine protease
MASTETWAGDAHSLTSLPRAHPLARVLARVFNGRGRVVGAAFLTGPAELLTCAHVVTEAAGDADTLDVDFPFLRSERLRAKVTLRRPIGADPPEDVAVLTIDAGPPDGAHPSRLLAPPDLAHRAFEVCGFPKGNDAGAWAEGRTGQRRADGTLQVGDPAQTGYPILPGFSGAPVWDVVSRGVLGMVVARERDVQTKVAFVHPIEALVRVVPLPVTQRQDPYAVLTAGVEDSIGGLRQMLAEYLGQPTRPIAFGGRSRALDALDRWLATDEPPYGLLVSQAGRGKTALVTRWVAAVAAAGTADVAFLPVSTRFGTGVRSAALRLLLERLRYLLNIQADFVSDPSAWRREIERLLQEDREPGDRPLLVVIDGADEAADWELDKELRFSPVSPRGVRVLVAARRLGAGSDWSDRLHWRGITECFELDPLDRDGIADVLHSLGIEAVGRPLLDKLVDLTGGDPLELQLYAQSLAGGMTLERLSDTPPGLDGYFQLWWEDQEQQWADQDREQLAESEDVSRLLRIVALARGALSAEDLAGIGGGRLADGAYLSRKLAELGRFLIPASGGDTEAYVLSHPRLDVYFATPPRLLQPQRAAIEEQIFAYCRAALAAPDHASEYAIRQLGVHAELASDGTAVLYALVQPAWKTAWERLSRAAEGFATDVDRAWRRARRESAAAASGHQRREPLRQAIRCALVQSSLITQASRLEPELLTAMLQAGLWTPQTALEFALRPSDPVRRRQALIALAPYLPSDELQETQRLVTTMPWEVARWAFGSLLPWLADDGVVDVLELAQARGDASVEAEAQTELARRQRAGAAEAALEAVARAPEDEQGQLLLELQPLVARARLIAVATTCPGAFARLLSFADDANELIAQVPRRALPALVDAAFAASDYRSETSVTCGKLIGRLPPAARRRALERVREEKEWRMPMVLVGAARTVPAAESGALIDAVLASLSEDTYGFTVKASAEQLTPRLRPADVQRLREYIREHEYGLDALVALAAGLSEPLAAELRMEALAAAGSGDLATTILALWPLSPAQEQEGALAQAIDRVFAKDDRGFDLARLAPLMSAAQRERAITEIRLMPDPWQRARALVMAADALTADERPAVLREAFAAAQTIHDVQETSSVLIDLASDLHDDVPPRLAERLGGPGNVADQQIAEAVLLVDRSPAALSSAFDAVAALGPWTAVHQLRALAEHMDAATLGAALDRLAALADTERARQLLNALSGAVPAAAERADRLPGAASATERLLASGEVRMERLDEILAAIQAQPAHEEGREHEHDSRVYSLASLAEGLPADGVARVLGAAALLARDEDRVELIAQLARTGITEAALPAALDSALGLGSEPQRAVALSALAAALSGAELARAKDAALALTDRTAGAIAVASLLRAFDPDERLARAREFVARATAATPPERGSHHMRGRSVAGMVPLDDVLVTRIVILATPVLPPSERPAAIDQAVRWLEPLPADWQVTVLLEAIDDLTGLGLLEEASRTGEAVPDVRERSSGLSRPRAGRAEAQARLAVAAGRADLARAALLALTDQPPIAWPPVLKRLGELVVQVPVAELEELWGDLLPAAARASRSVLATVLGGSQPILRALGDDNAADTMAEAILDVTDWIP